ncbi:MAG: ABC transporter permease subunit, partial [Collinsella aerofaciens]|nr:ABC transporter permease subunit [Collinsella aerofaciens]
MKAVAAGGAVAAFWLAVWVLVAGLVAQPLILPGPGAVVVALLRLVCDGGTWAILAGSGARILGGLALAAVCGGLLAGISSRSRAFARLVAPALSFVKATPVACVVVLLLIWLGSARVSIAAVFLMALPGVYFSLVEGLAQVDQPLEQMFRLHGVRGWRLFFAHTWREVLPFVLSCARAVTGMSWKAGVAAELIGMAVGCIAAALSGKFHLAPIGDSWFRLPAIFPFGFQFNSAIFLPVALVSLVCILEAVGDLTANCLISKQAIDDGAFRSRLKGGILADGISCL